MAIITLTTDLGTIDPYVAAIKGSILSQNENAQIVDITHHVKPFNISMAAFILKQAYPEFPKGSIHIVGVTPEADEKTPHLIVAYDDHFFIGADNGIFSLLFDRRPDEIFELNLTQDRDELTFPTKNLFAKAASHLARGGTPEVIGKRVKKIKPALTIQPVEDGNVLKGTVMYVDTYGNIITNIHRKHFRDFGRERNFEIVFRSNRFNISKLHKAYHEVAEGERVALFSSSGYLEIAINKGAPGNGGGANTLFGLKLGDMIRVEFS